MKKFILAAVLTLATVSAPAFTGEIYESRGIIESSVGATEAVWNGWNSDARFLDANIVGMVAVYETRNGNRFITSRSDVISNPALEPGWDAIYIVRKSNFGNSVWYEQFAIRNGNDVHWYNFLQAGTAIYSLD